MEHLKAWAKSHKALAIGGGLAIVVLLYVWLRSGSTSTAPASSDSSGLAAYYAAQAAGAQDTVSSQQSTDALAASTSQTNAAETVALAQTTAATAPYQAELDAITLQTNLTAYQDYLGELGATGTGNNGNAYNAAVFTGSDGNQYVQTTAEVLQGIQDSFYNLSTGQTVSNAPGGAAAGIVTASSPFTRVNWNGPGTAPVPVTPTAASTPLQFGQFVGATTPQLSPVSVTPPAS